MKKSLKSSVIKVGASGVLCLSMIPSVAHGETTEKKIENPVVQQETEKNALLNKEDKTETDSKKVAEQEKQESKVQGDSNQPVEKKTNVNESSIKNETNSKKNEANKKDTVKDKKIDELKDAEEKIVEKAPKIVGKEELQNASEKVKEVGKILELFPDANLAKAIANKFGKSVTDSLTEDEINQTTQLVLAEAGITDATGIEIFKNVESLGLDRNKLKTINLKSFSKLRTLGVAGNNLTEVDVSHNPNLELLFIGFNDYKDTPNSNRIKTIDISKNPKLSMFDASAVGLETLDTSNNFELTAVYLNNNNISQVDFSANKKLKYIWMENNKLTSIDLSNNEELVAAIFTNNQLTKIDISNQKDLEDLYIEKNKISNIDFSNNPKLSNIFVGDNNLTKLDTSMLENLDALFAENNQLTSISLEKNSDLRSLNLSGNKLNSVSLENNYKLESLDVSKNKLETVSVVKNNKIHHLNVSENNLNSLKFAPNSTFGHLNISNTNLESIQTDFKMKPFVYLVPLLDIRNTKIDLEKEPFASKHQEFLDLANKPLGLNYKYGNEEETDKETPVLTAKENVTVEVGSKLTPSDLVTVKDNKDPNPVLSFKEEPDFTKAGKVKVTVVATDKSGNRSEKEVTVTVKEKEKPAKNQAPELTVPFTTTLHVGDTFDPMKGVKAVDKEDGDLTSKVKYKGKVDTSKPGKYIVEYSIVDSQGVNATATQSVIVEENGETPDMEPKLTVPVGATINVGDSFDPMAGVSAIDKEDGDITSKVTVDGKVNTSKAGIYVLTYTVKDSAGHEVTATQKVVVKEKDNGNGSDNGNNNGNGSDNGNSNISNNGTSDKKEDTYKELPKTGASTNNSAAMGVLMVLAGMVLSFGRKFRKVLK
ncbi:immunoglobulin-like domain-containing protein [Bacillus cereus group sp. BfR-BA-01380]|uniref:immunoglobulin-like domain-containing protein n=1 Tax=Bacillus cereus group sp. BfR-BA-01380 TaxID=2920324 RepID=UPI001F5A9FC4|nr:immunoglobulin-like domain-containing protein [Bacillus cereus group sp. BfR-BA-01380]